MTPRQFFRRVEFWQRKLSLLGLGHWRISVDVVAAIEPDDDDETLGISPMAHVDTDQFYDTAEITVRRDVLERSAQDIDEVIVHELLHVLDRDRDTAERSLLTYLSQDAKGGEEDRLRAAKEAVIERLARQIVALVG